MSQHGFERVVTPEAVELSLDVAGIGPRSIATIIDAGVQSAIIIVAAVGYGVARSAGILPLSPVAAASIGLFFTVWGYYGTFELIWHGRTPGKRAQGLRVVSADGQPARPAAIVVRNLLRLIDFLPGFYSVGVLAIIFTRRSQRLGDLAAGTIVVKERRDRAPTELALAVSAGEGGVWPLDVRGLSDQDYALVRSFLQRRPALKGEVAERLAGQIAGAIRPKVAGAEVLPPGSDQEFLEQVARAFRAKSAQER